MDICYKWRRVVGHVEQRHCTSSGNWQMLVVGTSLSFRSFTCWRHPKGLVWITIEMGGSEKNTYGKDDDGRNFQNAKKYNFSSAGMIDQQTFGNGYTS